MNNYPLRMNDKLKAELQVLAKKDGRSLNNYINKVLDDHVSIVECERVIVGENIPVNFEELKGSIDSGVKEQLNKCRQFF